MNDIKKGGLCFVGARRHVKANNHYLEDFGPTKPESYLMYWDANNLYGWAMCQYLPYKNLRLNTEVSIDQVLETADDSDVGYIIECDLNAPQEIHELLKQFSPCPENMAPTEAMLSEYQRTIAKQNNVKIGTCKKLVPHLMDKLKYCIHYRNLKFVEKLGFKIKVHNIVSFDQKAWMKPY